MKRCYYIMIAVMALGAMSCNRTQTQQTQQQPEQKQTVGLANCDMVLLEEGKLVFFNNATQEKTTFTAETDPVVNVLFDDNNRLYYNVAKAPDQLLTLKMLDLNVSNPQPQSCIDWQLTVQDITNPMFGKILPFFWDDKHENIIQEKCNPEDIFVNDYVVFNPLTQKIRTVDFYGYSDIAGNANCKALDHFFTEGASLYYATPEGKFCLNDNIDYQKAFENEGDLEELGFVVSSVSPDASKAVFSSIVYMGEGWGYYCVSSCDGHKQLLLDDSDISDNVPQWLADGTLVYVGHDAVSPDNNEDRKSFIKTISPDQTVRVISNANYYAVKPFDTPMNERVVQEKVEEGVDLAILDQGKLTFYNSLTDHYFTLATETDSVINGAFDNDNAFFYTVAIGDELYLKQFTFGEYTRYPELKTSWDLKLEECVSGTYGEVAPLVLYPELSIACIAHEFNWDYYGFEGIRLYDYGWGQKREGWDPDEQETDSFDEDFLKWDEVMSRFHTEDNHFYYNNNDVEYDISYQIDFHKYVSDPSYYSDPEFDFISIDPTNKSVIYGAIIEYGDLGHGPLCFASLDGSIQLAFPDTDVANLTAGWLGNGSLVYLSGNTIKKVNPQGLITEFYQANSFITRH